MHYVRAILIVSYWISVLVVLMAIGCVANDGTVKIHSGAYLITIQADSIKTLKSHPCTAIHNSLLGRPCSKVWGVERWLRYTIRYRDAPALGVVRERLIDLGHNYEPYEGCSDLLKPQRLTSRGEVADHIVWIIDTPPERAVYKRCGQVLYLENNVLMVNIFEFRMNALGSDTQVSIEHLPSNNPKARILIDHFKQHDNN